MRTRLRTAGILAIALSWSANFTGNISQAAEKSVKPVAEVRISQSAVSARSTNSLERPRTRPVRQVWRRSRGRLSAQQSDTDDRAQHRRSAVRRQRRFAGARRSGSRSGYRNHRQSEQPANLRSGGPAGNQGSQGLTRQALRHHQHRRHGVDGRRPRPRTFGDSTPTAIKSASTPSATRRFSPKRWSRRKSTPRCSIRFSAGGRNRKGCRC